MNFAIRATSLNDHVEVDDGYMPGGGCQVKRGGYQHGREAAEDIHGRLGG